MKKKILLFIKTPPPVTGATLMNQRVNNSNILRYSFDIRSICISYSKNILDMGSISIQKILVFSQTLAKLFKELLFHRPQMVYFQISPIGSVFIRDLIFTSVMKLFQVKILYHLRGKGIKEELQSKLKKVLYKYAFNDAEVVCVSDLLKYDIDDVHNGNIYIVNNGIPDVPQKYIDQNIESPNSIPRILFLSNLLKSKGIIDFFDSLKILNDSHINFVALIVGAEGDLKREQLFVELNNRFIKNKVKYLGPHYNDDKYKIISEIDILVFPTKNDIWGNVILEAMQMSKPVIATKEGAIPEIIDNGINGFLIDKSSPQQIAERVEYLIKNPELSKQMGKNARKKYEEKYTLKIFEENLLEVFKKALG